MPTNEHSDPDDLVGYKHPPIQTRFKAGRSGNPKGRPKKTPTLGDAVLAELDTVVTITVGGKERKITLREAIAKQHTSKAAKGDAKSTEIVMSLTRGQEEGKKDEVRNVTELFRAIHDRHVAADRNANSSTLNVKGSEDQQP